MAFTVIVRCRESLRPFPVPVTAASVTAVDFMALLEDRPSGAAIGFSVAAWDVFAWDVATGSKVEPLLPDGAAIAPAGGERDVHVWVERRPTPALAAAGEPLAAGGGR